MHLHQLKYFVAIVETGSITKAAERCYISQPSISQQLSKLEDSVGKKLFSREKGKLILTDAGKILYDQGLNILNKVAEAKRQVNDMDSINGGLVAIGVLPTLAPFMLPKLLATLKSGFPDATITVREESSESLVDALSRGEVDIIIDALPFEHCNLIVEPLFNDEFYVATQSNDPIAKQTEIKVAELEKTPFILLEDIHCLARQIEHYCFSDKFVPKVLFQASQIATVKQLIELGCGISILPGIAKDPNVDSNIRYIRFKEEQPHREVVLATVKDRYLGPAARYFIETLKSEYQVVNSD